MKNFLFLISFMLMMSCKETPKTTAEAAPVVSDSAQIADAIHGFYTWYSKFVDDTTNNLNFVKQGGKHYTLDQQKLDKYLANVKAGGYVSADFMTNELAFYKKCEQLWQTEEADGPPIGMDADKYFCAQDWELDFYTKSPVRMKSLGNNKYAATMFGTIGGTPKEQNFELVKENGKWLLSKIECDMGLESIGSEQSLVEKLAAFYRGKTPCSDCSGVETVLTLNADQARTYTLEETHTGKKNRVVESSGTWSPSGDMVTLTKGNTSTKYQLTKDGLVSMNSDGSARDAKSASKYLLKKVEGE